MCTVLHAFLLPAHPALPLGTFALVFAKADAMWLEAKAPDTLLVCTDKRLGWSYICAEQTVIMQGRGQEQDHCGHIKAIMCENRCPACPAKC